MQFSRQFPPVPTANCQEGVPALLLYVPPAPPETRAPWISRADENPGRQKIFSERLDSENRIPNCCRSRYTTKRPGANKRQCRVPHEYPRTERFDPRAADFS